MREEDEAAAMNEDSDEVDFSAIKKSYTIEDIT